MKIEYERSGGFAGMRFAAKVDTASLPPAESDSLRRLITEAKFFNLPAMIPSAGADGFTYKVTVEEKKKRHTVEVGDSAIPDSLRPLVERLHQFARRSPQT
jgi:hypothetical protein